MADFPPLDDTVSAVSRPALPIDACISDIRAALHTRRAVVVRAAPGAGKSTRVPPALVDAGRVVVLQPRRLAARAVARRIAEEQGWTVGREAGWHVRFDRRFSAETRVLLVTEGMLTHYLDDDPLLTGVSTVVLDEFHERSVHTDVGLALVSQAWRARDDLRLVVMSATMDPAPVQAYLDNCPLVDVPGPAFPLEISYAPGQRLADALEAVVPRTAGDVLCFLPGAGEIHRAIQDAQGLRERVGIDLLPLYGSLDADAQDRVLQPGRQRRAIFATNVAETSLTVPGVAAVIDTGLQKVARYDAERAIDHLVLERVTADSADQRAGRAARLGPGVARRLWDRSDRLRPAREAEVHRVDLAGVVLGLMAAGSRPETFPWFDAPTPERIESARQLLSRLGAIEGNVVTALGHRLRRLPLHPRLARVLVDCGGAWEAAVACAVLAEPNTARANHGTTSCDLLPEIDGWSNLPPHTRQVADTLSRVAGEALGRARTARVGETDLRRALLAGFPDRVARRRPGDRTRVVLASGRGAIMSRESGVTDGDWLVALEVVSGRPGQPEALVRMASRVEPEWLAATSTRLEHRFDDAEEFVTAFEVARYDALTIGEHPVAVDPDARAELLAARWRQREPDEGTRQLLCRATFAGIALDLDALAREAARSARRLADIDVPAALPWEAKRRLEAAAPDSLQLPSGRTARLTYRDDGTVSAAVKLQELFGLGDTPRIGARHEPVTFELLAPNGRPVQITRDLRSFWTRTYPEVRKELRGRYPRHPWPDDPWTATPTHRTVRRS
jgi:ATP-dependent helicase HrpB